MGKQYALNHVNQFCLSAPALQPGCLRQLNSDLQLTELSVTLALSDYSLFVYNAIVICIEWPC